MRPILILLATSLAAVSWQASAADPAPEIQRPLGTAQAVGAAHTLRSIPEACARLEGVFTGDAAQPYKFAAVKTNPQCQPRARFVDYAKAQPSAAAGWKLNDVIRVPSTSCAAQQAVVRVWRLPADNTPKLDGQGSARIYLQDAKQDAQAGKKLPPVTMYAAEMKVEGKSCGG
ncbi:MAG: hypothetical protein EOP92_06890 [Lysobacteraceae bacterium]|nr:MAG: hypothetical protein EOP92_06890 [Xanthomonadaceae bacterium]